MLYSNILAAYDGSPHSKKALDQAVKIIQAQGAGALHVVVVADIKPVDFGISAASVYLRDQAEDAKIKSEDLLKDAKWQIPRDIKADFILQAGSAGPAILKTAETVKADLIVIGSRGRSAVEGLLMGSVSSHVASRAACPVLVVK